jgi:transposase
MQGPEDYPLPSGMHMMLTNKNGGNYINGQTYPLITKIRVGDAICAAKHDGEYIKRRVASQCGVSTTFVTKIENELNEHKRVLSNKEVKRLQKIEHKELGTTGVGCRTIDDTYDRFILYALYLEQPYWSLGNYQDWLCYFIGSNPSKSTISRYLKTAYPHSAGFVKPNMVPYDKFRQENIEKAYDYIFTILQLDPARIIFGDEKLLKGQEIFNRLVRRDPMTGQKPAINPDPDFRNTHSITGFCSIVGDRKPLLYRIHEGNNNAEEFACDVESALLCGYLRPGDFLVLDNAAYHMGKENDVLEDWLWEDHGVMLIFLPPRSPEWNPIELVWAILVRRLRTTDLVSVRETYGNNASANVAADILDDISLDEVKKCYRHCYQFIANLLNKN